ncbi:hypothetical protein [Flavobacterium sp. 5]|uniref:hypothetical protein n=1 Tax=Flavobacterium sp. 5 TaxID=2035199 RepID=UPI000C2CA234|nr:hypothetical protein [Flavobacterium sp. 5]PKB16301.1 hypothetical protein CLU82_1431 [Flavobacterium sp. 5]
MKKLIPTLFLFLCVTISSKAQTNTTANEFYSYLISILENKKTKSIQLLGTNYGTMGSKFNWEAKFKKDGKKIEIQYNTQKPNDDSTNPDVILMTLDTTFVTTRKKIIKEFKTEITAIESRPVYFSETYKIIINSEHSNKEQTLKRADGLSFLLRYDKSFEEYYKEKSEKRKSNN